MKQAAVVAEQFGVMAKAYLASSVHAQGEDLKQLHALVASHSQAHVLDLGCGGGHVSFAVAPVAATVIAADLSASMLAVVADAASQRALHNIGTHQAQAECLPFADASFDIVVTRFSAHHWGDVPAGLREVNRVLKAGGTLVVIDIVSSEHPLFDTMLQAVEVLRDASHVRDYRVSEWRAMLAEAGFSGGNAEQTWKLKMVFNEWIARMRTPPERVAAIHSLFAAASEEVGHYFAVEEDDSFSIDAAFFQVKKVG